MKKFIQKTTSVFMSLAMVALIGAPAYAAMPENEPENIRPEIIESVLPDIASEEATLAVDFIGKTATESDAVPSAYNGAEEEKEEAADIPEEKEDAAEETVEEETTSEDIAEAPSDPVISEDDILDYIQSEEVKDALEDAGVDVGELEESIESGDAEVVVVPEDELPENLKDLNLFELYGASVLSVAMQGADYLTSGLFLIAVAPFSLFLWVIPPVGAAYTVAGIPLAVACTLGGVALVVISPIAGAIMTFVIKSE